MTLGWTYDFCWLSDYGISRNGLWECCPEPHITQRQLSPQENEKRWSVTVSNPWDICCALGIKWSRAQAQKEQCRYLSRVQPRHRRKSPKQQLPGSPEPSNSSVRHDTHASVCQTWRLPKHGQGCSYKSGTASSLKVVIWLLCRLFWKHITFFSKLCFTKWLRYQNTQVLSCKAH